MTVSDELLNSTMQKIHGPARDLLYRLTPFLDLAKRCKGVDVGDHGPRIINPVATGEHSSGTAHPTGYERPAAAVMDILAKFVFEPADVSYPVFIARKEEEENKGNDIAVVKLAETRHKNVMGIARRDYNKHIIAGTSALWAQAGLNTLYGHSTLMTTTGLLEGRAVASQSNTVGGLAKTVARGAKNAFADVGDDASANLGAAMDDIYADIRLNSEVGPPQAVIFSSQCWRNYKRGIAANERWGPKDKLDAGNYALEWNGVPVEMDPDMPTHATDNFEASGYFLNFEQLKAYFWTGCEFDLGAFETVNGPGIAPGRHALLYIKTQLGCNGLSGQGFLADGNTI